MTLSSSQFYQVHRAPGSNAVPMHDVESAMPGYYSKPHRYYSDPTWPQSREIESQKAILGSRGRPDNPVKVYRAVPQGVSDINSGDWVTPSLTYANNHNQNYFEGKGRVISKTVPASHLRSNGNPTEWGYWPEEAK